MLLLSYVISRANLNSRDNADAGADEGSKLAGGKPAVGGWGWTYWERHGIGLSWKECQNFAEDERRGGALLTLTEARELLRHQVLCPGEDCWVAVVPDVKPEDGLNHVSPLSGFNGESGRTTPSASVSWNYAEGAGIRMTPFGNSNAASMSESRRRPSLSKTFSTLTTGLISSQDDEVPADWVQVR